MLFNNRNGVTAVIPETSNAELSRADKTAKQIAGVNSVGLNDGLYIMRDYKRVQTSAEVWAVIRARHPELQVFGSFSAPDGDYFGDTSKGRMFTSLGFDRGDYPVIEAETTWDISRACPSKRNNEKHEYWLCLPIKDDV